VRYLVGVEKVRWVVVGAGDIAVRRVLPGIIAEPRSTLAGIVTSGPAKAEAYGVRALATLGDALDGCDAVYLSTPVAAHHPLTLQALAAGKYVLCEKPVAMNYEQAAEMSNASRGQCGVAYYRRTYPAVLEAKRLMAAGAIGKPVAVEMCCQHWFAAENGHRAWLLDPKMAGGGPLFDIGSHRIDLANFLFGRPVEAVGLRSNAVHTYAVEDNATVLIGYDGGARATIDIRWHARVERDECRIVGTDGVIELSPLNSGRLRAPGIDMQLPPHANLHYPLIADFVSAVLDRRAPVCPIEDAIQTDWVTAQIR
jgi:predicted dehydrogenase